MAALIHDGRSAHPQGAVPAGRGRLLTVGCLGVALVVASMVAFNTALGDIAVDTSATQTQLNWIVDGYTLVLACLLLPAGALGDRYGRRRALLAGLALFAAASLAPAFLTGPTDMVVARMVAGAGAALVMPATLSLLTSAYTDVQRARAIGLWAGVAGSAGVLGMLASAVLLHFWDWRAICWAFAAAGVAVMALAARIAPSREHSAPPVDVVGATLIAAAIAALVYGLLEAPNRGWTNPVVIGCMAAALVAAMIFCAVERRRRWPLIDVRLFGDARFAAGVLTVAVLFAATFGFFYLAMQYVQLVLGYSPLGTAVAFAPFAVPLVALSALAHRYAPRLGLRVLLTVGLLTISAGFVAMLTVTQGASYLAFLAPLLLISAGIGLCTAPATTAIMGAVGDDKQGVASAMNDAAREVGAAVGMAVAGSVLADRYTQEMTRMLSDLPDAVRATLAGSAGRALHVAEALGPLGPRVAESARAAFVDAMHVSTVVMAIAAAVCAVVVGFRAPRR